MTYSNTIPAGIIPYVRTGARAALDDAEAGVREASQHPWAPRRPEEVAEPQGRVDAFGALLDLIGWTDDEHPRTVEIDPRGDHLWAIREALARFERDHPADDAESEVDVFCLDVGLRFRPPSEREDA